MAKVQKRRTISFNRVLFELIHNEAQLDGVSASSWVSKLVRRELKKRGSALPLQFFEIGAQERTNNRGSRMTKRLAKKAIRAVAIPFNAHQMERA